MVQVIEQSGWGSNIGKGLGQGISAGLEDILQNKMEAVKQERQQAAQQQQQEAMAQQYEALGLPPGLASLNPTVQKQILQQQAQEKLFGQLFGGGQLPDAAGGEELLVGEETVSTGPSGRKEFTDEQIAAVSLLNPQLGGTLQKQKEAKFAKAAKEEEFGSKRAQKFFANLDERAEGMVQKESALANMEDALQGGNLGFFSPDNLANITGIEGLRSPKGAQFITSGKEFFLGSLKRAGARPNQWIEQQIQKMLPQVGRSQEANLTVVEALKSEMAIERAQQEIAEELLDAGIPKGKIMSETNKRLRQFAVEEQKRLRKRLGEIAGEKKQALKKVKPGTKVTTDVVDVLLQRSKGDVQAAKKLASDLGYEV